jgi:hypothetical protein
MKKYEVKNSLFQEIRLLIEDAKIKIVRNVNSVIVYTYFEIGKLIIQNEQEGKERKGKERAQSYLILIYVIIYRLHILFLHIVFKTSGNEVIRNCRKVFHFCL